MATYKIYLQLKPRKGMRWLMYAAAFLKWNWLFDKCFAAGIITEEVRREYG